MRDDVLSDDEYMFEPKPQIPLTPRSSRKDTALKTGAGAGPYLFATPHTETSQM